MRNTLRSFLAFVALLVAGCGGGGQGPVGHSDLVPPTRIPVVVARLYLGGDVPGATLTLVGLDGRVLATGVTNRNGMVTAASSRPASPTATAWCTSRT